MTDYSVDITDRAAENFGRMREHLVDVRVAYGADSGEYAGEAGSLALMLCDLLGRLRPSVVAGDDYNDQPGLTAVALDGHMTVGLVGHRVGPRPTTVKEWDRLELSQEFRDRHPTPLDWSLHS